jgi:putative transposase
MARKSVRGRGGEGEVRRRIAVLPKPYNWSTSLPESISLRIVVLPASEAPAMQNLTLPSRAQRQLSRLHLGELSAEAKKRLKWFDWHRANGENVSKTCRHFSIARATFYRWLKRYDPKDLRSLEDRSSRPRRCRKPSWELGEVTAVRDLREQYPFWGKLKLAVLLLREGLRLAASRIGRILRYLKRTRQLKEPLRRSSARRRQWKRAYATRKPREYQALVPGDIVQIDTMDVRPEPGIVLKQFTTVDVVSRWSVPTIAGNATALLASRALDELLARMPFPVRAIQVDGGSEFMADFEAACQQKGILLFELPPRSPKLNGRVERANRTYREEFYDCSTATPTVAGFRADLLAWEHTYNHVRPHQALGYLTPAEFLQNFNPTREALSRTS